MLEQPTKVISTFRSIHSGAVPSLCWSCTHCEGLRVGQSWPQGARRAQSGVGLDQPVFHTQLQDLLHPHLHPQPAHYLQILRQSSQSELLSWGAKLSPTSLPYMLLYHLAMHMVLSLGKSSCWGAKLWGSTKFNKFLNLHTENQNYCLTSWGKECQPQLKLRIDLLERNGQH